MSRAPGKARRERRARVDARRSGRAGEIGSPQARGCFRFDETRDQGSPLARASLLAVVGDQRPCEPANDHRERDMAGEQREDRELDEETLVLHTYYASEPREKQ